MVVLCVKGERKCTGEGEKDGGEKHSHFFPTNYSSVLDMGPFLRNVLTEN